MESAEGSGRGRKERDEVKVKLKTLKAVMEQCRRALESINADGLYDDDDDDDDEGDNTNDDDDDDDDDDGDNDGRLANERENCPGSSSSPDHEAEELCGLIKSRLEGPEFLHKIESMSMMSAQLNPQDEGSSWDMVNDNDLWEGGNVEDDQEYVVVRQEDIVDGIANFMATYLLSLEKTKFEKSWGATVLQYLRSIFLGSMLPKTPSCLVFLLFGSEMGDEGGLTSFQIER